MKKRQELLGLRAAYQDADKHSWKKEELIAYDNSSIAEQDARGKITAAENKVKEEVIERCLEEDMSIEMIPKIVNLPIEEVLLHE